MISKSVSSYLTQKKGKITFGVDLKKKGKITFGVDLKKR
jgi:hypothetical protein